MHAPARFSKEWWAWIVSTGMTCGAVAVVALYWTGQVSSYQYILVFLIAGGLGDLVLALGLEAVAPTRVTVGPGERLRSNSPLRDRAKVVSEFSADGVGKVSVRGEIWSARCISLEEANLSPGQEVGIAGRDGLKLLIDISANDN